MRLKSAIVAKECRKVWFECEQHEPFLYVFRTDNEPGEIVL